MDSMNAAQLLGVIKATIREIDNHIALYPAEHTKLPELRHVLASVVREAEETQEAKAS